MPGSGASVFPKALTRLISIQKPQWAKNQRTAIVGHQRRLDAQILQRWLQGTLEMFLAYNIQDVVNLETLLVLAYNLKLAATPFAQSHRLALPVPPKLPFQPDRETVQRLKRQVERCLVRW